MGKRWSQWRTTLRDASRRHPRALVAVLTVLATLGWFAASTTMVFAHMVVRGVPTSLEVERLTEMARASTFFDASDKPAFSIFKEQRREVPLDEMSPFLKQAIVAVEDQRFYDHRGVDAIRVVGAALANLREGRRAQGGSTITQQLARLGFLTPEKTFRRKIQEVMLAALIESELSKEQILELYLNKVYFGAGLYGAEAASLGYFGKHASELSAAEAALIAGLVKSPSTWAPTVNLERALARRAVVLQAMRDTGQLDEAEWKAASSQKVALYDALRKDEPYGQYFKEQARLELLERFGRDRVYEGGLRIFTTIDLDMQKAAEAEVQKALKALETRRARRNKPGTKVEEPEQLQAALVSLDVATGAVRALVGGRNFEDSKFNRAVQARRQPGSAFKPFVYAAALEAGYTPASVIENLDEPIETVEGDWVPEDEHSDSSTLTMRMALRMSSNRAAVRMIEEVGIKKTVAYAERLGVGDMPSVPSLALGSGEVTLESMTAAYGVFASGGVRRSPHLIRRVEDAEGKVLYSAEVEAAQVISPQSAFLMTSMLSDVINNGTAWKARQLGFKLPAAGKTGTTNDYRDAWFVGYTPKLVTGVWVGFDQPQTIFNDGYAAEVAVPLWANYMRAATRGDKADNFAPPSGIVSTQICRLSGKLPADGCEHVTLENEDGTTEVRSTIQTEYFIRGTEPTDTCPLHVGRSIFGRMAGWFGTSPGEAAAQPVVDETPAPPPAAAAEAAEEQPAPAEAVETVEPEQKKRGFWGRIFGRRKGQPEPQPEPRPDAQQPSPQPFPRQQPPRQQEQQ